MMAGRDQGREVAVRLIVRVWAEVLPRKHGHGLQLHAFVLALSIASLSTSTTAVHRHHRLSTARTGTPCSALPSLNQPT